MARRARRKVKKLFEGRKQIQTTRRKQDRCGLRKDLDRSGPAKLENKFYDDDNAI